MVVGVFFVVTSLNHRQPTAVGSGMGMAGYFVVGSVSVDCNRLKMKTSTTTMLVPQEVSRPGYASISTLAFAKPLGSHAFDFCGSIDHRKSSEYSTDKIDDGWHMNSPKSWARLLYIVGHSGGIPKWTM